MILAVGWRGGSSRPRALLLFALLVIGAPRSAEAQSVVGTLLDSETSLPIPLGLVMMFTDAGDSVSSTIADQTGRFRIASPEPGNFVLRAVALGYRETGAGVFELGSDGVIEVEYRLPPQPLPIDQIVVELNRPTTMHHLVSNGFVRRFQRGLGLFVTPHDIEESPARTTEDLLRGLPRMRVRTVYDGVVPSPSIGEAVQVATPAGWCNPAVYIDGVRALYDPSAGITLTSLVDIGAIEAIEVYRTPAEIPVEYGSVTSHCGVLVAWSKQGLAAGQAPSGSSRVGGAPGSGEEVGRLPEVSEVGPPPEAGERIRVELSPEGALELSLASPWEGSFVALRDDEVIATDAATSRALVLPVRDLSAVQVERPRAHSYAYRRAAIWGSVAGLGTVGGLSFLCAWSACNGGALNRWLPAAVVSTLVAVTVGHQGPGVHWVATELPRPPGS